MDNEELTFRILGPPVKEVLEKFAGNRLVGRTPLQRPLSFHVSGQDMKGLVSVARLQKVALLTFSVLLWSIHNLVCSGL